MTAREQDSVVANDRAERRTLPYEPAGPTAAEHLADEHPPFITRSRSCGDFLADLRGMRGAA